MAKAKPLDPKAQALRERGCLNPEADRVTDGLFRSNTFFDARDLVQVKYEMLRRVRMDGQPISQSAAAFGFSRPSFYLAQKALERGGLAALVPRKPGPRAPHKLSDEVVDFLQQALSKDESLGAGDLARRVRERFGRSVHPRSVERALARREKKRL
jgi:transposase